MLGSRWKQVDYRDKLPLNDELRDLLGLGDDVGEEDRQCLVLHVAAAVLWLRLKREPKQEEVFELAVALRIALIVEARSAEGVLGEAPPWMPALEANIRMHLHDILFPHHEKDAKRLATFPTSLLSNLTVNVVRVG